MENHAAEIQLAERRNAQRLDAPDIRHYRAVYWMRLLLRVLSLLMCSLIVFVLVDATRTYERTKHLTNPFRDSSGRFPVWPDELKLYPSYVLLGAALTAGLLSLILVLASFVKSIRRMTKTGNVTASVVSSICLVLWVAVTAYYESWDTNETGWDLLSWACTHSRREYNYQDIDFEQVCTEMRFAFWAGVGHAVIEAVNLGIFVVWWLMSRRSRGYAKV